MPKPPSIAHRRAAADELVGLSMAEVERLMIDRTLWFTGGRRDLTAQMLGIGLRSLYRKIREYGLAPAPEPYSRRPASGASDGSD